MPSSVWENDNYIGLTDYQRKRYTILGKNVTPLFRVVQPTSSLVRLIDLKYEISYEKECCNVRKTS